MRISFVKMHGLGNDFIVLDARAQVIPEMTSAFAAALADRKTGIGCDQLILLQPSDTADFAMRIFNADGGEVEACGNATRAVGLLHGAPARIETLAGILASAPVDNGIAVDMGVPRFGWDEIPLAWAMDTLTMPVGWEDLESPSAVNVGNPHVIFFTPDTRAVDLARLGPQIEHDPLFPASHGHQPRVNQPARVGARRGGNPRLRHWRLRHRYCCHAARAGRPHSHRQSGRRRPDDCLGPRRAHPDDRPGHREFPWQLRPGRFRSRRVSVEVVSLGCRLNLSESESMRAMLADSGGDLVVINSCAVTAEAVRQTRQAVRRARRARPDARLIVTGCAAETERAALAAMPEVDGLVANTAKLDPRAWNVPPAPVRTAPSVSHTRAYLAVQTGCDHACTFCIIPQGRGPGRSRAVAEVIAEAQAHLDLGVAEIVLTGVDLTGWGHDLPGNQRLGDLAEALLAACPTLARLRLSSLDGVEIDPALFNLLVSEPRVMPHVHLSLQHGHDLILKRMRRRHLRLDAVQLVERLRAARADISLGADLIAGFPTEDDAMHAANRSVIAELGIVHGHVFPYSPRPGTPAARMPQLPPALIRDRAADLRAAVAETRAHWLSSLIGSSQSVLAEKDGTGHAENFAKVQLPPATTPGTIVTITPTRLIDGLLIQGSME